MPVSCICPKCQRPFTRSATYVARVKGDVLYCSPACRREPTTTIVTCGRCQTMFMRSGKSKAAYCSPKCAWGVSNSVTLQCETCGNGFDVAPGRASTAKFCSRACRATGKHRECAHCGAAFYVKAGRAAVGQGQFCSLACHNINQGRNKTSHVCLTCGVVFRRSKSRSEQQASIYCSIPCRNADPEWVTRAVVAANRAASVARPTRLEMSGYMILDSLGVPYERYWTIGGKFTVDAAYPGMMMVVQFDGDYWHDRAGTSAEDRILRRVNLDMSQDAYMAAAGWRVLRYWESTVHDAPDSVRESISQHLRLPLGDVTEHGRVVRL